MLNGKWIGLSILIFLTLMAAMSVNVTGPFDARTSEPAAGVRVEYSPAGAVVEPVTALAQIIIGAPDMRVATVSVLIWILVLVACTAAVGELHRRHWHIHWRVITRVLAAIGSVLFVLIVYGTFTMLVHIHNWRAVAQDPDIVLAELHTHTFGSHDSLISAYDSLRWHRQRGCSVVAVTEHESPEGSLKAAVLAESDESLPAVLPGVEVGFKNVGYFVVIGSKKQFLRNKFDSRQKPFIPWFHQTYHGVVIVSEARFEPEMVGLLIDTGVDGVELASDGHHCLSLAVGKNVLAAATSNNLFTDASSDWHGIGSILRTWTAIRIPNAAALSHQQLAEAVLDTLRRHDRSNIIPLTVGHIRQVSPARAIFAPFTESIRYALGLSPLRLLAWWVWGIALFVLTTALLQFGIRPWKTILSITQAAMGIAILISSLRLIIAYTSGQASYFFPVKVGLEASALGIVAVLFGAINVWLAVIRRQKK